VLLESRIFPYKAFDVQWQLMEDFDPSIICAFLKARELAVGLSRLLVLIPCVHLLA
jgi:hypothetical protein